MPRPTAAAIPTTTMAEPDSALLGALPVLVVDDDPSIRALFVLALRRAGLEAIEAASGELALQTLDRTAVSVVLCDVGMPGMNGLQVVQAIRARPESATLPVILVTGSGDDHSVIAGLEAGADDYLTKPVRLDELIARVRAHLRTHDAWVNVLQEELQHRATVVAALGSLSLSHVPEEMAEQFVGELSKRAGTKFASVAQVTGDGRMQELATYNERRGLRRGGDHFSGELAGYLLGRARGGPWVDEVRASGAAEPSEALREADIDTVASAPILAGEEIVGLLSMGIGRADGGSATGRQAQLLAAVIDYASVLSATAGTAIAGRREAADVRQRLQSILERRAFHPVVQPIVEVETGTLVGFEALTRFDDGVRPDLRFAEAARADLGFEYELEAMTLAVSRSGPLPPSAFLSLNISPQTVIERTAEVGAILRSTERSVVLELTEHVPIDDYGELRAALDRLGTQVQVAVDDAGAGFASLRHILELRPDFAKLDISLVRGIDGDDLRQALAAGLNYYALRTGCRLIAEGVETRAEADALQRLGIEFAQGYLFGRPAEIETTDRR
jgi:EAL domain-containing protein (putative c-di-GMP-specific phosphodiesterase class I)/DNA-binding response OmpR family regulator